MEEHFLPVKIPDDTGPVPVLHPDGHPHPQLPVPYGGEQNPDPEPDPLGDMWRDAKNFGTDVLNDVLGVFGKRYVPIMGGVIDDPFPDDTPAPSLQPDPAPSIPDIFDNWAL